MDLQDPPIPPDVQVQTYKRAGRKKLVVRGPLRKGSQFQIPGSVSTEVAGATHDLNCVPDYDHNYGDLVDLLRPSQFFQDCSQSSQLGDGSSFHMEIDKIIGGQHDVDTLNASGRVCGPPGATS